jgi:hypothetical protein
VPRSRHRRAQALQNARGDQLGTFSASPHRVYEKMNSAIAILNIRRVSKRSANQPLTGMHTARLST